MGNAEGAKEGREGYEEEAQRRLAEQEMAAEKARRKAKKQAERQQTENERVAELAELFPKAAKGDLLRFLRARQLSVKDAATMYSKYLKWRKEFHPLECDDGIFTKQLEQNRIFLLRCDGESVPVVYFVLRNHNPDTSLYKEVVRFGVFASELVIRSCPDPSTASFIMLINCRGVGMKNVDMKLMSVGIDYYQDFFPERLHAAYVFGLPMAMIGLYHVLQKLMDERTRNKIKFLKRSEVAQIFPDVPEELVPEELRGGLKELDHDLVWKMHGRFKANGCLKETEISSEESDEKVKGEKNESKERKKEEVEKEVDEEAKGSRSERSERSEKKSGRERRSNRGKAREGNVDIEEKEKVETEGKDAQEAVEMPSSEK